MVMMDEVVGHMTEKVVIPPADEIEVTPRRYTTQDARRVSSPTSTNGDMVPDMVHAGEGYRFHVTGLTHDERGYPNMTPPMQDTLVTPPAGQDHRQRRRDLPVRRRRDSRAPTWWWSATASPRAWPNAPSTWPATRA